MSATEQEARATAASLGLGFPALAGLGNLVVTKMDVIEDEDLTGLTLQLSSSAVDPLLAITLTPVRPCYPDDGEALAAMLDGVAVYRRDSLGLVIYSLSVERPLGTFVSARFTWEGEAAPTDAQRLAFVASWLRALSADSAGVRTN